MQFTETKLAGVLIIEPDVYRDSRGFFLERYNLSTYAGFPGLDVAFVQDNHSQSKRAVLRGLHLQRRHPQGKLVSAVRGTVWDVAVDIDPASPTFREWVGVELSEDNHRQLYVPPGYAHGFCVLSERADVLYKCTEFRHADDEYGILWNDPDLAIDWPVDEPVLSVKDAANPGLAQYLQA
ncbi:MAG: dTDP-4-dehydrorhamnose 3,5-epimerase [Gammaproteobacteria bacterium]|nr:dTDP-4-dehydrorhamnose 3,5-epimerase [Gammaproteobacteria bacterium]